MVMQVVKFEMHIVDIREAGWHLATYDSCLVSNLHKLLFKKPYLKYRIQTEVCFYPYLLSLHEVFLFAVSISTLIPQLIMLFSNLYSIYGSSCCHKINGHGVNNSVLFPGI